MTTACIMAWMLLTVAACSTGNSNGDDPRGGAAELVTFDGEPLWTMVGGRSSNDGSERFGLEYVVDARLVGDQLVLVGGDEDGDLNELGESAGVIVVVNAETGEPSWSINDLTPLSEDPEMMPEIGDGTSVQVVDDGDAKAIAIVCQKTSAETFESGVASLAIDSGKLLSHTSVTEEPSQVSVEGVSGADVFVTVTDSADDGNVKAMLVNLADRERIWSRDDVSALGMAGDTVVLGRPGKNDDYMPIEAVARDSGETLWESRSTVDGEADVESVTSALVVANTTDGVVALDAQTGKQLDLLKSETAGGCIDGSAAIIACTLANNGLMTIPAEGKSPRFSKIPDTENVSITSVASRWIFTANEDGEDGAGIAVDPAGNSMETPGNVADMRNGLAVVYTGKIDGEVTTISVYKVKG